MGVKWVPALLVCLVEDAVANRAKHFGTQELLQQLEPGVGFPVNTANAYRKMWCERAMEWATLNAAVAYTMAKFAHLSFIAPQIAQPVASVLAAQAEAKAFAEKHFKDKGWTSELKSQLQNLGQALIERVYAKSVQRQASVEQEAFHHRGNKRALTWDVDDHVSRTLDKAGRYEDLTNGSASEEEVSSSSPPPPQTSNEVPMKNLTAVRPCPRDLGAIAKEMLEQAKAMNEQTKQDGEMARQMLQAQIDRIKSEMDRS